MHQPSTPFSRLDLTPLEKYVVETMMPPDAITPAEAAARRGVSEHTLRTVRSQLRKRMRVAGIELPDGRTLRGNILRRRKQAE